MASWRARGCQPRSSAQLCTIAHGTPGAQCLTGTHRRSQPASNGSKPGWQRWSCSSRNQRLSRRRRPFLLLLTQLQWMMNTSALLPRDHSHQSLPFGKRRSSSARVTSRSRVPLTRSARLSECCLGLGLGLGLGLALGLGVRVRGMALGLGLGLGVWRAPPAPRSPCAPWPSRRGRPATPRRA